MGAHRMIHLSLGDQARLVTAVGTLLESGLQLVDGFSAAEEVLDGRCSRAAEAISSHLREGVDLHEAVTDVIPGTHPVLAGLLRLADRSGDAAGAMVRAAAELRSRLALRGHALSAAIYPALVITATMIAALVIVAVVLPAAREVLAPFSGITGSHGSGLHRIEEHGLRLTGWTLGITGGGAAGAAVVYRLRRVPAVARRLDTTLLRVPLMGGLVRTMQFLLFARAVAVMGETGSPMSEALASAAECVPNQAARAELREAAEMTVRGVPASRAVAKVAGARIVSRWLALAEAGADVGACMGALASILEQRVQAGRDRLTGLLEPLLTIAAGAVVLALVLGVVRPLFALYGGLLP